MKYIFVFLIFLLVISIALAEDTTPPEFSDPYPEDDSYVLGGDRTFSINITEDNLDTSTVKLYIKSIDSTEWDTYSLTCVDNGIWYCSATVSLDIVGSDTIEQFYFEANDTYGNYASYGNATNPLQITVDINPPKIIFNNPKNNTWVSSTETIELYVHDKSSLVDETTVKYSFDNTTWYSMDFGETEDVYYASWNTTTYSNNETVVIHAKASDMLGNMNYTWVNTTVDNEIPSLIVTYPSPGQTLNGIVNLKVNVSDSYSGINSSFQDVSYDIQGIGGYMDCTESSSNNYRCNQYVDTTGFDDGTYTINFYARDNAGNLNQSSISIYIDNTRSSISFTNIADNDYIRDIITIYAKISNPTEELGDVNFKWTTTSSSSDWQKMTCDSDYNCSITWNTNSLTEGTYTLFINTTGTMDYLVSSNITITVDNTPPTLDILQPLETQVSGMIYPKVLVTDYYSVNPSEIKFEINGETYSMNCLQQTQNKQYRCTGNFNTTSLSDGTYTLKFIAKDQAGNENSTSKEIIINNLSPGETTTTQEGEVTTTTISSGEESGVGKTIRNTTNKINNYFSKIIYNKSALIAILVLISIVFISYFLLRNIGKQKIEIEENEI